MVSEFEITKSRYSGPDAKKQEIPTQACSPTALAFKVPIVTQRGEHTESTSTGKRPKPAGRSGRGSSHANLSWKLPWFERFSLALFLKKGDDP